MSFRRAPEYCAHFGRAGKERCRLAIDAAGVGLNLLVGLVGVEKLEELPITELAKR